MSAPVGTTGRRGAGAGYERRPLDAYFTEPWVTRALCRAYPIPKRALPVWEPAGGRGDMSRVLEAETGRDVIATDVFPHGDPAATGVIHGVDFFFVSPGDAEGPHTTARAIVTNPPFRLAEEFLHHALAFLDAERVRFVAFLLRHEWDAAAGRQAVTARPDFAAKITLTARPRWDDWQLGKPPKASPREVYAWFVWDRAHQLTGSAPRLLYAGREG